MTTEAPHHAHPWYSGNQRHLADAIARVGRRLGAHAEARERGPDTDGPDEEVAGLATGEVSALAILVATLDLPPFTNSAMDGYAVRHADTPGRLEVVGESAAGSPFADDTNCAAAVTISLYWRTPALNCAVNALILGTR